MRRKDQAILQPEQLRYLDEIAPDRDELLERMADFASENDHPIADDDVARLLGLLTRMKKPERVLEIGTNIGYSVIAIGRALRADATIETIEIDPGTLDSARRFVEEANLACDVVFHQGAALEVIPSLERTFDLVFIDCVKTEYEQYVDLLLPRLPRGGLLVFDNMLWGGEVASQESDRSDEAIALDELNRRLMTDPRFESVLIPMSDGVTVALIS